MKQINKQNLRNLNLRFISTKPQMKKINVFDENFLYDANSMSLYHLKENEESNLEGVDEVCFYERNNEIREKHIVFQATYACNLKCRYCFVENHYCNHENTMTEDEHYEALKKFQPSGNYRIGWFGGEPLLNWEIIFKVTEKIFNEAKEKNKMLPRPHITTNGVLITEEIAAYCAEHNFSWIVSIDGPEQIHNQNRPYKDGQGSFYEAMRGLKYLADAYKKLNKPNPITVRATFDTVSPDILETTKFLNELMYKGLCSHVSVEPSCLGEGCSVGIDKRIEKLKISEVRALFFSQYEETAKWFLEELQAGRKPSLHHFEMPLQRIYDRDFAVTECGAGMGYVSVGPGGKICACHREHRTEIGDMETGIDKIKQAKWLDNRFYVRDLCNTCWRRAICGGGCRCNSLLVVGRINQPAPVECLFHDMQFKCAMWLLSKMTKQQKELYSKPVMQFQQNPNFQQNSKKPSFQQIQQKSKKAVGIKKEEKCQKCSLEEQKCSLEGQKCPCQEKENESEECKKSCQVDCQSFCMYPKEIDHSKKI